MHFRLAPGDTVNATAKRIRRDEIPENRILLRSAQNVGPAVVFKESLSDPPASSFRGRVLVNADVPDNGPDSPSVPVRVSCSAAGNVTLIEVDDAQGNGTDT
jgi:hypothetical protein